MTDGKKYLSTWLIAAHDQFVKLGQPGKIDMETISGTFRKDCITALAILILGFVTKTLLNIILAHWLGAASYGDYAIIIRVTTLCAIIVLLGSNNAVVKFIPEYISLENWELARGFLKQNTLWLVIILIIFCVTSAVTSIIIWLLHEHQKLDLFALHPIIFSLWLVPLIAAMTFLSMLLRSLRIVLLAILPVKFFRYFILVLLASIIYVATGTVNIYELIVVLGVTLLIIIALQLWLVYLKLPHEIKRNQPRYNTRHWLGASLQFMLTAIVYLGINSIELIMLEIFGNSEHEVGYLSAIFMITTIIYVLNKSVSIIIVPLISTLLTLQKNEELQQLFHRSNLFLTISCLLLSTLIIIFGHELLSLFGSDFQTAYPALVITTIGVALSIIFTNVFNYLLYSNHQDSLLIVNIITLISLILFCLILIPKYQISGASVAFVISRIVMVTSATIIARAHTKLKLMFVI